MIIVRVLLALSLFVTLNNYPFCRVLKRMGVKKFRYRIIPGILISLLIISSMFFHFQFNSPVSYFMKQTGFQVFGVLFLLSFSVLITEPVVLLLRKKKKLTALIPLVLAGGLSLIAWYSAYVIDVTSLEIRSDRLSEDVKILHITDIHTGSRSLLFLERVVKRALESEPDIVVITGDYIDDDFIRPDDMAPLKELQVPVLAVFGNHEMYLNGNLGEEVLAGTGVMLLRNRSVEIQGVQIIGIDDNYNRIKEMMSGIVYDPSRFVLLLNHQTVSFEELIEQKIDLTLSGHTHKGQIFPFNLLVKLRYPYLAGYFREGDSHLYIGAGTGTWGPAMRLGSRNEMTLIHLIKE